MTFPLDGLIATVTDFGRLLVVCIAIVSRYLCLTCCIKHVKSIGARNDAQREVPMCRSHKYYQTKDTNNKSNYQTITTTVKEFSFGI